MKLRNYCLSFVLAATCSPRTPEVVSRVVPPLDPSEIQLELPDFGAARHPPGILHLPEPEKIRRLFIHIPRSRIHRTSPKINTFGTGLVQTSKTRKDEVVFEIDLANHDGRYYDLSPRDNTLEVTVTPFEGADPLYVSWVIAPPKEALAWKIQGSEPNPGRALPLQGEEIFEKLDDGRLVPLDNGVTSARRVLVEARLATSEEALSLRVRRSAPGVEPWSTSVGDRSHATTGRGAQPLNRPTPSLEAIVDLEIGENRLDVEVADGYRTLSRSTYRILRRAPTEPLAVSGEKWAVVVGISKHLDSSLDLQFADRDARSIRDLLVEHGGFSPQRVRLLTDEAATQKEVRAALLSFLSSAKPEDLVLIFFAGHGVQDTTNPDNYFFLTHDSKVEDLGGTALPMWEFSNALNNRIRARRIFVLADSCHSGALDPAGESQATRLNFFNKYLEVQARKKGRLVLTASQAHQIAREKAELSHGVFTDALLKGLAGQADDNPTDGVITAGELLDFVRVRVPAETNGEQHPSFAFEGFDLNTPLARAPHGRAPRP